MQLLPGHPLQMWSARANPPWPSTYFPQNSFREGFQNKSHFESVPEAESVIPVGTTSLGSSVIVCINLQHESLKKLPLSLKTLQN